MITLCMETSHKYLVLALIEDDKIISRFQEVCLKKQSEYINIKIDELCKSANVLPFEIDQVCVTKGPGSYTGVRIAMSVAKVICSMRKIKCYTISTFQLYSVNFMNCSCILDARSNRIYYGIISEGKLVKQGVDLIENVKNEILLQKNITGECGILGIDEVEIDLCEAFLLLKNKWELVENIHSLQPIYLKESSEYLVK